MYNISDELIIIQTTGATAILMISLKHYMEIIYLV